MVDRSNSKANTSAIIKAERELCDYLYNKSVSIVGNASDANMIAAHQRDVVVGVNSLNFNYHGMFWGSTVTNFPLKPQQFLVYNRLCIVPEALERCSGVIQIPYTSEMYMGLNPRAPEEEWLNAFSHSLGTNPLTGILAIAYLLRFPIKELFITGFTFYKDGNGVIPYQRDSHLIWPQLSWLRFLSQVDYRISMDKITSDIVMGEGISLEEKKDFYGKDLTKEWREHLL